MFTVKRTTTSLITHKDISVQKYEYRKLSKALKCFERLKKEDKARHDTIRYKCYPLFFDDYQDNLSYHFTAGKCKISCEIEGVLEDAKAEFFIDCQLKEE